MKKGNKPVAKMLADLRELARIAAVMVDGDEAGRILTKKALYHLEHPDPDYRHMVGDYYDVEHAPFLRTKKTLMRLARLVDFACDTTLWLKVGEGRDLLTVATHNGPLSRWYRFGAGTAQADEDLARCLETGKCIVLGAGDPDLPLTALAPVRDSLGEVVGLVELSASHPESTKMNPVWN